jgi:hypothetical protein
MVSGIRNTRLLALAAAGALAGSLGAMGVPVVRREQRDHSDRAWERRQRRKAKDEMRERLLRQSIAAGRDDRADKYLHAAARRRREAERAATSTEA